jgi:uncharacterized membrane protein YfcA
MLIATATSLTTIEPTSLSSIRSHHKKDNVDFNLPKSWGVYILIGVVTGCVLVTEYGGQWLTVLFVMVAIQSSLNMLFRHEKILVSTSLPRKWVQRIMASCIGFFSAMVGIGGGTFSIPILVAYRYHAHKAVGTAAGIGLIISFPAAITMLTLGITPSDAPLGTYGLVKLLSFVCIVPLTVFFAPVGAKLANTMNANFLKKVFAVVLLITDSRMFTQLFI